MTCTVQSFLQGDGPALQECLKQWAAGSTRCVSIRYLEIALTFFNLRLAAISRTFGEQSTMLSRTLSHYCLTGTRAICLSNTVVLALNPFFVLKYASFNLIICWFQCHLPRTPLIEDLSCLMQFPSSFPCPALYMIFMLDYSIQIMSMAVHSTWISTWDCL